MAPSPRVSLLPSCNGRLVILSCQLSILRALRIYRLSSSLEPRRYFCTEQLAMSPTLAHSNSPAPLAPKLDAIFAPRAIMVARPPGPLHGGHSSLQLDVSGPQTTPRGQRQKTLSANSGPTNWHVFVTVGCLTALQKAWPVPPPTLSRTSFIPTSQVCNFNKSCSKDQDNTLCHGFCRTQKCCSLGCWGTSLVLFRKPVSLARVHLSARSDILPGTTSLNQVPQRAYGWTCGCASCILRWSGVAKRQHPSLLLAGLHAR